MSAGMVTLRRRPTSRGARGQALVEFSLVVLMFFSLLVAILDMAMIAAAQNSMNSAVREAARWGSVDGHWTDVSAIATRAGQRLLFVQSPTPVVSCEWVGSGAAPASTPGPNDCMRPGYVLNVTLNADVPMVVIGGRVALSATSRMAVR